MPDINTLVGIGYPKRKIGYPFGFSSRTEDNMTY